MHTECQLTALRKNFTSAAEKLSCKIPVNSVKQNLECLALIVLTEDLKNFSCKDWSEDFDWLKFDLKKGNVLAYQNFQPLPFPDDPNIFKNVASIFSIYKRPVDDEPFEVDLFEQKGLSFVPAIQFESRHAADFERDDNFSGIGLRFRGIAS